MRDNKFISRGTRFFPSVEVLCSWQFVFWKATAVKGHRMTKSGSNGKTRPGNADDLRTLAMQVRQHRI